MSTPRTSGGGGGGGGGSSTRKSRVGDITAVVEPNANNAKDNHNNNSNNNSSSSSNHNHSNSNSNFGGTQKGGGGGGGTSRLPSIKERRPSVQKKLRTASTTTTTTGATNDAPSENATVTSTSTTHPSLQRQESSSTSNTTATTTTTTTSASTPTVQRRTSVNQGLGQKGTSRPTFAGIGRRVSNMVRARMAFQQNRRKSSAPNVEEVNHMEAIHEMPRNPRFSTFLSAEAQYAMMKGYEDMLYEKIAHTNPESRLVLKRTKTPYHKKVVIVDNELTKGQAAAPPAGAAGGGLGEGKNRTGDQPTPAISSTTPTSTAVIHPESEDLDDLTRDPYDTRTPTAFRRAQSSQSTVSSEVSKSMMSSYPSHRASGRVEGSISNGGSVGFALHRSSSLPSLKTGAGLSHQKRLVLTYRLESAMDILDTLKRRNKENSLSPRVYRIPRQVDAVKDFNSWTKVWNKEFKVAHAK